MAECYDCGLRYDLDGWADVVVPDAIWKQVSPTGDEGGLLCFTCMNRRLVRLGLCNVPFQIASGAFAFMTRDLTGETRAAAKAAEPVTYPCAGKGGGCMFRVHHHGDYCERCSFAEA